MAKQTLDIEALEKVHGKLTQLTFGEDTICLKKPTRTVVSMSISKGMSDPLAQAEVVIDNCMVGGTITKEEAMEDIGLLLGINTKIGEILGYKQVQVKN